MEAVFNLPLFPVYLVDYLGATVMVILAFCALFFARRLTRLEPKNILWAYFFWFFTTALRDCREAIETRRQGRNEQAV